MKIIVNDCENIVLESSLIEDYLNNLTDSMIITCQVNCCSAITEIELTASNFVDNTIVLSQENMKDGLYQFNIITTYSDGSKKEESNCTLISCNQLDCAVLNHIAENEDSEAHLLLYILKHVDCDCQCNDMCIVYGKLLELLNSLSIENEKVPCQKC